MLVGGRWSLRKSSIKKLIFILKLDKIFKNYEEQSIRIESTPRSLTKAI